MTLKDRVKKLEALLKPKKLWVTIPEAVEEFGYAKGTLYQFCFHGKVSYRKTGGTQILRSSLEKIANAKTVFVGNDEQDLKQKRA